MKQINASVGSPVKKSSDIKKFIRDMKKDYNIELIEGIEKELINTWEKNKLQYQHIVAHCNQNEEWFIEFLSDSDVLGTQVIDGIAPLDLITQNTIKK